MKDGEDVRKRKMKGAVTVSDGMKSKREKRYPVHEKVSHIGW